MQYLSFLLAFFIAVSTTLASDQIPPPLLVADYMQAHSRVWNDDGVCRHAAAELAVMARRDKLQYKVPQFSTDNPDLFHVTFSVLYESKWYHIDSVMDEPGRYNPVFRVTKLYRPRFNLYLFKSLTGRPITGYIQDIDDEQLNCWYERCENTITGRIDSKLEQLSSMSAFLKKWENAFRGVATRSRKTLSDRQRTQ